MCDTLVVVRPNQIAFAKNSDRDPNEAQLPQWLPAAEFRQGEQVRCTWMAIPQVRRTHAILISRPYWTWGAEMGSNAAGLVIGNEAVFTKQPFDEPGLSGMDLVRLALERAACVEEAVETIRGLIAKYGQGGRASYSHPSFRYHNSFLIADMHGACVLETAGREVAVERIAQGARAISNGLTLPALRPQADRLREKVAACNLRRSRMELFGRQTIHPSHLAAALRDHGDGQQHPRFSRLNGALSAPCVHYGGLIAGSQTVGSWISILSSSGCQHWITGTSSPCLSLFRPVSIDVPRNVGSPEGHPDSVSLWWRFERLHRRILCDWNIASQMRQERDEIEAAGMNSPEDALSHWQAAEQWLSRWELRLDVTTDNRPRWLRNLWSKVEAEAAGGNRLPPRYD